MIDGTNLNQLTGSRQLLRAFGGINETYSCSEAELSAALNFSGRGFPALQTRAPGDRGSAGCLVPHARSSINAASR